MLRRQERRIVVLEPDLVAAATVVGREHTPNGYTTTSLVSGHDALVLIVNGEGSYRVGREVGVLGPRTLIAAPAGNFTCVLSDLREAYVLTLADTATSPGDRTAFTPFAERTLSASDARFWRNAMMDAVDRAARARLEIADTARLKIAATQFVWRRESQRETVNALLESLWPKVGTELTLGGIARDVGYTANYLNDLVHSHTGRPVGKWITDMRMARARVYLKKTAVSIANVAIACGYQDPAYFSRAFRREHGTSALRWRLAARPADKRRVDMTLPIQALHVPSASSARSMFAC